MPPVLPINVVELVAIVLGCLMVLIPVTGLTARFAIKPIVEALGRGRESGSRDEALALLERRTALLEQEVQNISGLRTEMERLVEELAFQRELKAPASSQGSIETGRQPGAR